MLPQELGCGSGMTCWRRLRDWQAAGVWDRLHRALLDRLGEADQIDWERACLDSASVPAKKGAAATGPDPTNRGKPGTKRHLVVDRRGTPLAVRLTGANRHDSVVFEDLIDAIPPIQRPSGQRRRRPGQAARRQGLRHARAAAPKFTRRPAPRHDEGTPFRHPPRQDTRFGRYRLVSG